MTDKTTDCGSIAREAAALSEVADRIRIGEFISLADLITIQDAASRLRELAGDTESASHARTPKALELAELRAELERVKAERDDRYNAVNERNYALDLLRAERARAAEAEAQRDAVMKDTESGSVAEPAAYGVADSTGRVRLAYEPPAAAYAAHGLNEWAVDVVPLYRRPPQTTECRPVASRPRDEIEAIADHTLTDVAYTRRHGGRHVSLSVDDAEALARAVRGATEQESVADDSDLIDEDPIPFGTSVDLPGDRCWVHHQGGRSASVRRRDAWAHYHGWPELARATEEKSKGHEEGD